MPKVKIQMSNELQSPNVKSKRSDDFFFVFSFFRAFVIIFLAFTDFNELNYLNCSPCHAEAVRRRRLTSDF
jgi:hypothetical protein